MKKVIMLPVLLITGLFVSAQENSPENIREQMVKDWERAKTYTLEYLQAMPADKYGFRAQDSIRSFAQLMLHLAQGNIGLVSNGTGKAIIWRGQNLESRKTAQTADSVLYFVSASYDYVIDAIKNMDVSKLWDKNKRGSFDETRYAWLQKAFEHQTHTRGQTTIYIRLVGLKPPNARLF